MNIVLHVFTVHKLSYSCLSCINLQAVLIKLLLPWNQPHVYSNSQCWQFLIEMIIPVSPSNSICSKLILYFRMYESSIFIFQAEIEKKGFPTIAELACKKDWAPIQNLCRRRVIEVDEAKLKYQEKTAMQWAVHHGEIGLAHELQYLLVSLLLPWQLFKSH